MKQIVVITLLLFLAGCVSTKAPDSADMSRAKTVTADGLKLRVPRHFKKFEENGVVLLRPEPPVRPSPGVLIKRETTTDPYVVLDRAMHKIRTKMGGAPLAITTTIAGRQCMGITDELPTHFIWLYAIPGEGVIWTLQVIAPIQWTDAQALALHDMVVGSVRLIR